MTDRKSRPLWPLLTAVLIGLPVLYVASFGPVADRLDRGNVPASWREPLFTLYAPLVWMVNEGPQPLRSVLFEIMLATGYRMT